MRSELSESARKEIIQRHAHYERERRTAACIKACEGIPTETLEGGFEAINAELLEALRGLVGIIEQSDGVAGYHLSDAIATWDEFYEDVDAARAAIRKAEGSDE